MIRNRMVLIHNSWYVQCRPDLQLMLNLPDKAIVQACKAVLQQSDPARYAQQNSRHNEPCNHCQAQDPAQPAAAPTHLSAGTTATVAPPVMGTTVSAPMECKPGSAVHASNPHNQGPKSCNTSETDSATHSQHDGCRFTEQAQIADHSTECTTEGDCLVASPAPTIRHVPTQSMLLDAILADTVDVRNSPMVTSSSLPTAADATVQPSAATLLHQGSAQQGSRKTSSRMESLLDAMLA